MTVSTQTRTIPNQATLRIMELFAEYNKSGDAKENKILEVDLSDIPISETQLHILFSKLTNARLVGLSVIISPETRVLNVDDSLMRHLVRLTLMPDSSFRNQNLINISLLSRYTNLVELNVMNFATMLDFSFLSNLTKLKKLNLSGCTAIKELSPRRHNFPAELTELRLANCSSLKELPDADYTKVRVLNITNCSRLRFLDHSKNSGFFGLLNLSCEVEGSPQLQYITNEIIQGSNIKHITQSQSGRSAVLVRKDESLPSPLDMKEINGENMKSLAKSWSLGHPRQEVKEATNPSRSVSPVRSTVRSPVRSVSPVRSTVRSPVRSVSPDRSTVRSPVRSVSPDRSTASPTAKSSIPADKSENDSSNIGSNGGTVSMKISTSPKPPSSLEKDIVLEESVEEQQPRKSGSSSEEEEEEQSTKSGSSSGNKSSSSEEEEEQQSTKSGSSSGNKSSSPEEEEEEEE